jgi:60 kDa SS-A/Ro ribonucleoprotein
MARIQDFIDHLKGKTTTFEGGVAYKMSFRETLAEFFSLGLLNGTFYQTREAVMNDAVELFTQALAECPEFAAKAAVYGHKTNSLKLVPVIWAAYLSTLDDKTLFHKSFPLIVDNINLLHDFMEVCRKTPIRKGLGRSVKRAINKRLTELANDYSVSRNKTAIAEIVKVTRPLNKEERFQNYMRYVSSGELTFERARELKRILEKISRNEIDADTLAAIEKYHFQLEELKHAINNFSAASVEKLTELSKKLVAETAPEKVEAILAQITELKQRQANVIDGEAKRALYGALYKGLRYAALILNLVALERVFAVETKSVAKSGARGRFTQEQVIKAAIPEAIETMVCEKIRDAAAYRASNMLPFALINAQCMVTTSAFKDAIADMLETCAKETFVIPADTEILVGVDLSGSMSVMISDSLNARSIGCLMAALLKLSHPATKVCGVSNNCSVVSFDNDNLFDMAQKIERAEEWGGTYLAELMNEYTGQKYVLFITDSETADDFECRWRQSTKRRAAKLIVWQLQAYHIKLSQDPQVIYIAGFSDRVLALIKAIIEDTGNQLTEIDALEL